MRRALRVLVLLLLAGAVWRVYVVRGRLASDDADPAQVARLRSGLDSLPLSLADGRYRGVPEAVDDEIVESAGADSYANVRYEDAESPHSFRVYVGGSIKNRENFHAPSYCMPASGWESLEETTAASPVPGRDATVRRLLLQYGAQRMLVYYWFQAGDRTTDHEWGVRWFRFLDLLRDEPFRPTIIVTLYVPVHRSVADTEAATAEFLATLVPHLDHAIASGGA